MSDLEGICTPVCTVFTEDGSAFDEAGQRRHLDTLLEAGIHIIAAAGGTGEFSFLSIEERRRVLETVVDHVGDQAKVIAHVSAVMTEETIEHAKHAEGLGVDALLILPPYFEGPTLDGVFEHYERVDAAVSTEIMAYNIPVHTGIDLEPEFCVRLLELPNIRYLKDSTGDHTRLQDLVQHGVPVFVGGEPIMFPALMAGAPGCFWGSSNAIPREAVALYGMVQSGRISDAVALWHRLYPLNRFAWGHTFNPSIKAAVNLRGGDVGVCRRPVQPLSDDELVELKNIIAELG